MPIGGAENKKQHPVILERFAETCGGRGASIGVIPTASQQEGTGDLYRGIFRELGAAQVITLPLKTRKDGEREDYLAQLEETTGLFITGGNQLRLSSILGGTTIAQRIRQLNADGVHVAGTSAGAAIIPEHMIAGGRTGPTPRASRVTLAPGLGLTNRLIIDQHFRQRDRLGRLLAALSYNPFVTGIGIDENTAAFIDPDGKLEVVGSGAITVVDPGELEHSSLAQESDSQPITLVNLKLHILGSGARYDVNTREVSLPAG